jgi:hypothetical protein
MSSAPQPATPDAAALKAEHDALGTSLEIRRSIDAARYGAYQLFAVLIAAGTAVALAWDRWGPLKPGAVRKIAHGPPVFLYVAVAATAILLGLGVRSIVRARRLMREEDALFRRYRVIRELLRLDP